MQIYLDCDGVLADFDEGATRLLGMDRGLFQKKFGRSRYLQTLKEAPNFYGTLKLKSDAMKLVNSLRSYKPMILTGSPGKWADEQKMAWASKHFPDVPIISIEESRKSDFCLPGDVLIDDKLLHQAAWEAKGGIFIHHINTEKTLAEFMHRTHILLGAEKIHPHPR